MKAPSMRHLAAVAPILVMAPVLLIAGPSAEAAITQGSVLAVLGLGFILGLKHALDADHLVAVSTMISEKSAPRDAAIIGLTWGMGHTASLFLVGVLVIVLRVQLPEGLTPALELGVASMIVVLGVNLLVKVVRHGGAKVHLHEHQHGDIRHVHPHIHYNDQHGEHSRNHHRIRFRRRPFFVGLVHGMAGSATLVLLALAELSTPLLGLLYMLLFGLGSVAGMIAMSTLFALPYSALRRRFGRVDLSLRIVASTFSIIFGIYMAYEIIAIHGPSW